MLVETDTCDAPASQEISCAPCAEPGPAAPRSIYVIDANGRPILNSLADARAAETKARNTRNQAARRARQRATEAGAAVDPTEIARLCAAIELPGLYLSRDERRAEAVALHRWLQSDAPQQRQIAPKRGRYLKARVLLLELRRQTWDDPEPAHFRAYWKQRTDADLGKDEARDLLRGLAKLEAPGGPWHEAVTQGAGTSR